MIQARRYLSVVKPFIGRCYLFMAFLTWHLSKCLLTSPVLPGTGALNPIPKQPSEPEGRQDQRAVPFLPSKAFSLSPGRSDRETKSYPFYPVVIVLLMGWILAPSLPPSLPQSNFVFKSESPPGLAGILAGVWLIRPSDSQPMRLCGSILSVSSFSLAYLVP